MKEGEARKEALKEAYPKDSNPITGLPMDTYMQSQHSDGFVHLVF